MENMYIFAVFKNEKKYEYEYLGLLQMVDLEIVTANRKVYELRWVKPKVKTPPSWGTRFACRSTEATTYSMLNIIFFWFISR